MDPKKDDDDEFTWTCQQKKERLKDAKSIENMKT